MSSQLSHTLFPKGNATLICQFFTVPLGFRPRSKVMSILSIMRNFERGSLANCYQEHYANDFWYKIQWCTLFPKRKATSKNLRFFWGRVYAWSLTSTANILIYFLAFLSCLPVVWWRLHPYVLNVLDMQMRSHLHKRDLICTPRTFGTWGWLMCVLNFGKVQRLSLQSTNRRRDTHT